MYCIAIIVVAYVLLKVAMLPWYLRKVAAAVYGEPPTSSMDEALSFAMKVRYHCLFLLKFIALKNESSASNFHRRSPNISLHVD